MLLKFGHTLLTVPLNSNKCLEMFPNFQFKCAEYILIEAVLIEVLKTYKKSKSK